MEKLTVERSIWIDVPRERVWQAVAEPEQFARWFLPAMPGVPMKRGADGRLSVYLGEMRVDVALFEVVDPPRQIISRSLPDQLIATAYTFDEEKGGTRVTVTMTGFEAMSEDGRWDRLQLSEAAWEKALENLKAYVGGVELPFPWAGVAALFGYWRKMPEKMAVERSIWMNAPRERVWRAITDPAQIEKWFSPGTQWRGTGLEVGGKLSVYNAETNTDMHVQVIEVVDPPYRLVTRSVPEPPEMPHVTDWTLAEENGGTRLTLTYTGYEHVPEPTRWQNMEENTFGFGMMLLNLKAVVEGDPLPFPGGF